MEMRSFWVVWMAPNLMTSILTRDTQSKDGVMIRGRNDSDTTRSPGIQKATRIWKRQETEYSLVPQREYYLLIPSFGTSVYWKYKKTNCCLKIPIPSNLLQQP